MFAYLQATQAVLTHRLLLDSSPSAGFTGCLCRRCFLCECWDWIEACRPRGAMASVLPALGVIGCVCCWDSALCNGAADCSIPKHTDRPRPAQMGACVELARNDPDLRTPWRRRWKRVGLRGEVWGVVRKRSGFLENLLYYVSG